MQQFGRIHRAGVLALFLCVPGVLAQQRNPLPVPDIAGYKTLKCDFHLHTVFSDGDVWPTTRVAEAWRDGVDAIAITDHAGYNPHKDDLPANLARPYQIAARAAAQAGIILIPGVEIAEGDIHANALFVDEPNQFMDLKFLDALRRARSLNAFVFWNHPGWKRTPEWFPLIASAHDEKLIQGMELVNGDDFYPEAYPWIAEKSWAPFANSDQHPPMAPGYRGGSGPLTLVFARTADPAGIREALFARRTAAWMGGNVWGAAEHLRGLWQGAVTAGDSPLSFPGGARSTALQIANSSAIPFRWRVTKAPEWLRLPGGAVEARSIAGLLVSITKDAPAGRQKVEVDLELTNFHVAPGKNLQVRLPLVIEVPANAR